MREFESCSVCIHRIGGNEPGCKEKKASGPSNHWKWRFNKKTPHTGWCPQLISFEAKDLMDMYAKL